MAKFLMRSAIFLVALAASVVVLVTGFGMAKDQGWLSPFGIDSEGQDTQVIQAVTRTQEVALLSLAVEGINDEQQANATVLGLDVPGTGRATFLRYSFSAKLGINGEEVKVTKTGENRYLVDIPEFVVIGYAKPKFEIAAEDDGILSWTTADIDTTDMVNEVFNDAAQGRYLKDHQEQLKEQAQVFYDSLITSIDPAAETTFEFQD